MNRLLQTRRCEECGRFFTVPLILDPRSDGQPETYRCRISGPWECEECRKHPITEKNPVGRHGISLARVDGRVGERKRPA